MNFKLIISVLLSGLAINGLMGAPGDDNAHAKSESPRFRTMGWAVSPPDLYYSLNGKDVPIQIFDAGRSGFYRLPSTPEITFYHLVKNPDAPVERVPVAMAHLNESSPLSLLLFLPDPAVPDSYRIVSMADDPKSFPDQSCRFINLTAVSISATVGDKTIVIPGGADSLVKPQFTKGENSHYTTIYVDIHDGKVILSSNNWVFRSGQRTLVCIFLDKLGHPQVVRVIDGIQHIAHFK
jgi:hypothetical protein